jgi:hypothetical protein
VDRLTNPTSLDARKFTFKTFHLPGGKWQVSIDGANRALWRRDGKELLFDTPDRKMMAVDVTLGDSFQAGVPRELFQIPNQILSGRWVMTPNADRFLFPFPAEQSAKPPMTVLYNWTATIKR